MKREVMIGFICFALGAAATLAAHGLAAPTRNGAFVRIPDMEWRGQESHGPATALKWVLGRESDFDMVVFASFWMTRIGSGGVNEIHNHANEEQIYYVLEGSGVMTIGEAEYEARAGDVGYFPATVPHGFANTGSGDVILIGIGARTGGTAP